MSRLVYTLALGVGIAGLSLLFYGLSVGLFALWTWLVEG